ncbi:Aste57867_22346 [Aphanomyces stellatus]|uniref:Aste57867_22346 protein n=1 Tax=Aphanomyces stellatus TaxID=120398 RepID=A0A485LK11_9STRA|nr:hypothetical protein As57867_022276 [Aphanomyces stellatus]VFT99009.1 Aste57867_22346 [Aphanomyces stellatus]
MLEASPEATAAIGDIKASAPSIWEQRPKQYKSVLWSVCGFILWMELAERLSYYGINQGLKNFMQAKLGWSAVSANSLKSTWTSLVYMSPLLGAYIADEKWGRYPTITVFGLVYLVGDVLLAAAAHPSVLAHHDSAQALFILGLFGFIGLGTGAIKSNVITLGADQFNPADAAETAQKVTFFSYFYWCINFGAAFAYGYLASLSVHGSAAIPAEYGYFACFSICACVMAIALASLQLGYSRYIKLPPSSRAMTRVVSVLRRQATVNRAARMVVMGTSSFLGSFLLNCLAAALPSLRLVLSVAAGLTSLAGIVLWAIFGQESIASPSSSKTVQKKLSDATDDDDISDIQQVVRILPFAAFTIVWGCVSDQIDANFQSITQQCDLRLSATTQLPGAVLGIFDPLAIMLLIPLLDHVVYPAYERTFQKLPSAFGKVAAGLVVSTVLMVYVGGFEMVRRASGPLLTGDNDDVLRDQGSGSPMNRLHWAWNIPQYVGVALCECLINVTAYDVFYSQVPLSLKSTAQAINLFTFSMGSNITSIFTLAFGQYIPDDLNHGHLEYMFFAVGALSALNVVSYVTVMRRMQFGMTNSSGYDHVDAADDWQSFSSDENTADDDDTDVGQT